MANKIIEIRVEKEYSEAIDKIVAKPEVINSWKINNKSKDFKYSIITDEKNVEMFLDNISKILHFNKQTEDNIKIPNIAMVNPIEGFLPKKNISESEEETIKNDKSVDRISTEQIYDSISKGTKITQNFLLNIILSSLVCSIGIIKRDVSILIAASTIAPFLGPILGYSFSLSIGDDDLRKSSIKTLFFGLLISISIGTIIGFLWNYLPNTYRIDSIIRSNMFNSYNFVLALASGASAGLAMTTGAATIMTSFMISVAILPDITITGISLGLKLYDLFINSIILLSINLMCIILTSQLIFILKKIKPKTRKEIKTSKTNNIRNAIYCAIILFVLIIIKIAININL